MCTLLLAASAHPRYKLVVAANRDEFYDRPTAKAAFWDDAPDVFAGRDLVHLGTWLGVTRTGRIAALTNFREPQEQRPDAPSRGLLVSDYLKGGDGAESYLEGVRQSGIPYSSYNLLAGGAEGLYWYSNKTDVIAPIDGGIFGVSNHLLDTPWPKVVRGKEALARVLEKDDFSPEELFAILADRTQAPDGELPDTGVALEWERLLSSIFIASENYGTRCSTILLVDRDLQATFIERTFDGGAVRDTQASFDWSPAVQKK
jgi:uncharacterized protein with NRDE domain